MTAANDDDPSPYRFPSLFPPVNASPLATFASAMGQIYYDGARRPRGNNADEWALFLELHAGSTGFLAVQIAEALDDAARKAK